MLTRVQIDGFKSFSDFDLALGDVNFLLGPNASGKSNLGEALRLVRDSCVHSGVEYALGRLGGYRLAARSGGMAGTRPMDMTLQFHFGGDRRVRRRIFRKEPAREDGQRCLGAIYNLQVGLWEGEPAVVSENLRARFGGLDQGQLRLENSGDFEFEPVFERSPTTLDFMDGRANGSVRHSLGGDITPGNRSIPFLPVAARFLSEASSVVFDEIENWCFYDISPAAAKEPSLSEEHFELQEDGSNAAAVLRRVQQDTSKEAQHLFEALRRSLKRNVPGCAGVEAVLDEKDGRAALFLTEREVGRLPARCLSDGTLKLLSLLLAASCRSSPPDLLFIEEPGGGLHPVLLEEVYDVLTANHYQTQVIATTHSPDLVSYCRPDEVVLFDKEGGATLARRASSQPDIDRFLENWSLGEAWVHGELGGVPR